MEQTAAHSTQDGASESENFAADGKMSGRARGLIGLLIIVVLVLPWLVWRGQLSTLFTDRARVMAMVQGAGGWGPLALIGLTVVQIIVAPIPGQAVNFVAGYVFGFVPGTIYSWLATLIGSTLTMGLARYAGRPMVHRLVSPAALARLDRFAAGKGLVFFFLIFLIPFLPDDLSCFLAGLTPLPLPALILGVAIGRFPGVATAVWVGTQADRLSWPGWLIVALVALLTGLVVWRRGERIQGALLDFVRRWT